MMKDATVQEILQLAISIEQEGVEFYNRYADQMEGKVKETLLKLADDEVKHEKYFQSLYNELKADDIWDYLFDAEVEGVFHSIGKSTAFNRDKKELTTFEEVINEGIRTEQVTIDFYRNMLKYAKPKTKEMLDKLVIEEESHKKTLQEML